MSENLKIPEGWTYHKLPATKEKLEFWGKRIDGIDNDSGDRLRWAELQLFWYLDTDETHNFELGEDDDNYGMYGQQARLLYTTGHSLVVHELDTICVHQGVRVPVSAFPGCNEDYEDLEPCPACHPEFTTYEDAVPDTMFELETTWYSYTECQTIDKLFTALRKKATCENCDHKPHPDRGCRTDTCRCDRYKEAPRPLSSPGERLIKQVAAVDPEIAAAVQARRRL